MAMLIQTVTGIRILRVGIVGVICQVLILPAVLRGGEPPVTVHFERKSAFTGAPYDWDVKVNDETIGKVANGETKALTFVPKPGNNVMRVEHTELGIMRVTSNEITFTIPEGRSLSAVAQYGDKDGHNSFRPFMISVTELKEQSKTKTPLVSVSLDKQVKVVVLKESSPIRLARGTEKTIEDTLTVAHSVAIATDWKPESGSLDRVKARWPDCEADIRASVEKSVGKNYGASTDINRSLTIKGDGSAVKVEWVQYYRTGVATLKIDGTDVKVPFEFREDFDLLTEDAK